MVALCSADQAVTIFAGKAQKMSASLPFHICAKLPSFVRLLLVTPLLNSQAAREAWSLSAIRSAKAPLIAAIAQPFSSGLFFLEIKKMGSLPREKKLIPSISLAGAWMLF